MKRHYLQPSTILFVMVLVCGCVTTPVPIEGDISIPQTFENVWYRPSLDKPGLAAMSDTGTFTVNNNSVEFAGEKERRLITLSKIRSISFKKLGSDLINNWVVIEYGAKESPSYAVMSAGKALGWAGGSAKIFSTIEYVIKKNNLTSVEINK